MSLLVSFLVVILTNVDASFHFKKYEPEISAEYYCSPKMSCGEEKTLKNAICARKPCGPTRNCGDYFEMYPLDPYARKHVVNLHNEMRHDMATIGITPKQIRELNPDLPEAWEHIKYYYPKLKRFPENKKINNMNIMSYSKELELSAQCWANSCFEEGSEHVIDDGCLKTSRFQDPGQSAYVLRLVTHRLRGLNFRDLKFLDKAVLSWSNQIFELTSSQLANFTASYDPEEKFSGHSIREFAQMMLPEAKYVGCGRAVHGTGDMLTYVVFCNYDRKPESNKPLFTFGVGCASDCPSKYLHPNRTLARQRSMCAMGNLLFSDVNKYLDCMYKLHAVSAGRVYSYSTYRDGNWQYPCLCGRELALKDDHFSSPFSKDISQTT